MTTGICSDSLHTCYVVKGYTQCPLVVDCMICKLTFSPMTDARNPSCAVRPTKISFFLVKPNSVMPRNFLGSAAVILGFWLGPFCLFFTSFWFDSLNVGLPGRAAYTQPHEQRQNHRGSRDHATLVNGAGCMTTVHYISVRTE